MPIFNVVSNGAPVSNGATIGTVNIPGVDLKAISALAGGQINPNTRVIAVSPDGTVLGHALASQLFATVNNEQIDDRVAALLVAGAGITLTYDDVANTLTITATGGFTVREQDGSPSVANVNVLEFATGSTVLDLGGGAVRVTPPAGGGGGGGGDLVRITSGIVGAGGTAAINIASIPNTYRHLKLVLNLKAETGTRRWLVRTNGDTNAANYRAQAVAIQGSAPFYNENSATIASVAHHMFSLADHWANMELTFFEYARADRIKSVIGKGIYFAAFASGNIAAIDQSSVWNNVAAISSLDISLDGADIAEGSTWELYGLN